MPAPGAAAWLDFSLQGWVGRRGNGLLACPATALKSKFGSNPAMVKTLRNWLEAHQLFAIVTGVLGAIVLLALILVIGGYLIVAG